MSTSEVDVLRNAFNAHDLKDEQRHTEVTKRVTDLEVAQADLKGFIRGRAAAMTVILAVAIPLLSEFVHAAIGKLSAAAH